MTALALSVLAGCQTQQGNQTTPSPTAQSTSTVTIQNTTDLGGGTMTEQKIIKPEDVSLADQDAFMKADAAKDPKLCDAITVDAYKKFCVQQASDKNSPPLLQTTPTQEKCQKTTTSENGVQNCINFEQ